MFVVCCSSVATGAIRRTEMQTGGGAPSAVCAGGGEGPPVSASLGVGPKRSSETRRVPTSYRAAASGGSTDTCRRIGQGPP